MDNIMFMVCIVYQIDTVLFGVDGASGEPSLAIVHNNLTKNSVRKKVTCLCSQNNNT